MRLKEKFGELYIEQGMENECEKITDEFAIGFYNWMQKNYCQVGDSFVKDLSIDNPKGIIITTEAALKLYKKN